MTELVDYGGGQTGASALEVLNTYRASVGLPVLTEAQYAEYVVGPTPWDWYQAAPDWVIGTLYPINTALRHAGSMWLALQQTIGTEPGTNGAVWQLLLEGVDIAFAEALEADLAATIAAADVAMDQQVQTAAASAAAAASSATQADGSADAAALAEAAAELAAANAQAASRTVPTWLDLAALTGSVAGEGAEVLDTDVGTHLAATATGYDGASTPNSGRYTWNAVWSRWERIGATGLSSKAAEADLTAEVTAREALIRSNGNDMTFANLLGFVFARLAEDGEIFSKYLTVAPDGSSLSITDGLGFVAASISADGISIKGRATYAGVTDEGFFIADPLGFVLMSVSNAGVMKVMGAEVGANDVASQAAIGPEVDLARVGIRRPVCTDLPAWRTARASVLQGIGGARILALGDSLTAGGSTEAGSLQAAAYPTMLARLLGNVYPATAAGFYGGKYGSGISAYDPRLTLGAGWTAVEASTVAVLGGQAIENTTTTDPLVWNPGIAWDTAEITIAGIGAGSYTADIGGATTPFSNTVGANTVITYDAGSVGSHALTIRRVSGDARVTSIVCTDSTAPAVTVINAARGGYEVGDYLDSTDFFSPANVLPTLDADLFLLEIGINNRNADLAPASYRSQLDALLALLPADADVLLIASASPASGGLTYAWSEYVVQMNEAAAVIGAPFIDLTIAMGNRATIEAQGWNSDGVHLTRAGLAEKAHIISKLLTA